MRIVGGNVVSRRDARVVFSFGGALLIFLLSGFSPILASAQDGPLISASDCGHPFNPAFCQPSPIIDPEWPGCPGGPPKLSCGSFPDTLLLQSSCEIDREGCCQANYHICVEQCEGRPVDDPDRFKCRVCCRLQWLDSEGPCRDFVNTNVACRQLVCRVCAGPCPKLSGCDRAGCDRARGKTGTEGASEAGGW